MTINSIRKVNSSHSIDFWQKTPSDMYAYFCNSAACMSITLGSPYSFPTSWKYESDCSDCILLWLRTLIFPYQFKFYWIVQTDFCVSSNCFPDVPNLGIILTIYNRTEYNYYERWKDCFLSYISNNTRLWNKVNPALPSPSNRCLYLCKHRPPKFHDSARRHSQICVAIAHFSVETNELEWTLINLNAQNITYLWQLIAFERFTHLKA